VTSCKWFKNGYPGGADLTGVGISMKFDFIIIHESGHEWFGNAVSAADVSDMWIQEGWTNYLESLYVEQVFGHDDGIKYANSYKSKVQNRTPIITTRGRHATPPQDMYFKGGLMLHTMRGVMDDDAKWFALVKETYETFKYKNILTEEMATLFTKRFGRDMLPIFNQYLRRTEIPTLELVFDSPNNKVSYRWKADEVRFAMPIRAGDKSAWKTLTPTTEWQTMDTTTKKDAFDVATDLYYVNVTKTDKAGELPPAAAAPAARTNPPEQTAYNDANKIKDLSERLTALRKIQADYPTSNFLRQVNGTVFNLLTRIPEKRAEVAPAFDIAVADAKKMTTDSGIQLSLISSNVSQALENGIAIDAAEPVMTSLIAATPTDSQNALRAQALEVLGRWYQAKGNAIKAEAYFKDALKLDPALKNAPVGLARLAAGNDATAPG